MDLEAGFVHLRLQTPDVSLRDKASLFYDMGRAGETPVVQQFLERRVAEDVSPRMGRCNVRERT